MNSLDSHKKCQDASKKQLSPIAIDDMSEMVTRQSLDMKLLYVNKAYCEFTGKTASELLGKNEMMFVHPEDRNKLIHYIHSNVLSCPDSHAKKGVTLRFINSLGKTVWIEWTGRLILDDDGNPSEFQAVGRDITQKKSSLENILTRINETVFTIDESGNIEALNNMLEKQLSLSVQQLEKALNNTLFSSSGPVQQLLQTGIECKNIEITLPRKKSNVRYLLSGTLLEQTSDAPKKALIILQPLATINSVANHSTEATTQYTFDTIITNNKKMQQAIKYARLFANNNSNILITGESGTGKELFAQSIHNVSNRKNGPFVAINCGAIPKDLIGSELFGYVEGAFTGAKKGGQTGKFEQASGGTLFLDEIGDMPLEQQVALLRVIQESQIMRIGDNKSIPVDVRVICATHKDLLTEIHNKNFRQDLYYRLNVMSIDIPPLRERGSDVALLFDHFMKKITTTVGLPVKPCSPEVIDCLCDYPWPGNVRELQNTVERLYYIASDESITVNHLPDNIRKHFNLHSPDSYLDSYLDSHLNNHLDNTPYNNVPKAKSTKSTLSDIRKTRQANSCNTEKVVIQTVLNKHNGNVSRTAKAMEVSRSTLYRKMKAYNLLS